MMNNDCKQLSKEEVEVMSSCEYTKMNAQKNALTATFSATTLIEMYRGQAESVHNDRWASSSPGCCYRLLPLFKDAVYPVGLGEQRGIAETHPQAQENPPERTHAHVRCRDHQERYGVAQEDSSQQHVAHLPPGRSYDGRVVVPDKSDDDEGGGDDPQHGDEDGEDGPGGVPLQLDDRDGNTASAVGIGSHLVRTQLTSEL